MIFPGMKKLCKKLNIQHSDNQIFGTYKDYFVIAFDGNNKKVLMIELNELPNSLKEKIDKIKNKYKITKWTYENKYLTLFYPEIFKPYSIIKIENSLNEIINIINESDYQNHIKCISCEEKEYNLYYIKDVIYRLCDKCYYETKNELKEQKRKFELEDKNYIKGLTGGFLFSLLGIIVQVLLFVFFKKIGAVSALLYVFLIIKGYYKFGGKTSLLAAFFIICLTVLLVIFGTFISYFVFIFTFTKDFNKVFEVLQNNEVQVELIKNIILALVVSSFFLFFQYIDMVKQWKFPEILNAKKSK